MPQDIKFLLLLLIVALILLIFFQNNNNSCKTNEMRTNEMRTNEMRTNRNRRLRRENFAGDSQYLEDENQMGNNNQMMNESNKEKIINNIIMRERENRQDQELDSMIYDDSQTSQESFENPIDENINMLRDDTSSSKVDNRALEELIREVNTGNDLRVNSTENKIFQDRSRSINSANKYRPVSYAESGYRYNFNGNETNSDFSELASYTNEANNILDNRKNNNSTFNGYPDGNVNFTKNDNNMSVRGYLNQNEIYGQANLKQFTNTKPESQQQKVMDLYNSDAYLPNDKFSDPNLTKGFQILENPVSVNNPNLIPVLKSIPVSSVMGSNRNSTYDIRSEPPNPKTVVSPFLNSSIQPDIYATNRGCL
jgi:hypothetical protein